MAVYTIDKRPKRLREGDKVVFSVGDVAYSYLVQTDHLSSTKLDNGAIFDALGLAFYSFAESAYGYEADSGWWPCAKERDFAALCRLVNALYDEIEKRRDEKAEAIPPKVPSPISLGWAWSEEPLSHDTQPCDISVLLGTRDEAMADAKASDLSPVYVFELFAGPSDKHWMIETPEGYNLWLMDSSLRFADPPKSKEKKGFQPGDPVRLIKGTYLPSGTTGTVLKEAEDDGYLVRWNEHDGPHRRWAHRNQIEHV